MTTATAGPPAGAPTETKDGAPEVPGAASRKKYWWVPRVGLVLVAFAIGLCVDVRWPHWLAPAGHVLRFGVFLAVSIAGSQWASWLWGSAVFSVVWLILVGVDWPPLRELRLLVGLLARNVGHLEAAFVWTAVASSFSPWSAMFTAIAAIYALGLELSAWLAGGLLRGWIRLWYRRLPQEERDRRVAERSVTVGNLAAGRRVIIALATVIGYGVMFLLHRQQARTLVPLFEAILVSIALRMVVILAIHFRTNSEVSGASVVWARYLDLPVTAIACLVIYGTRSLPVAGALADEAADRVRRQALPDTIAEPAVGPRGVALFIISDSQFHELRGERSGVHLDVVDSLVPVAVRPVELDLLSGVPFHHFGELYGERKASWADQEGRHPQWAHLGDFGDLGCWKELFRAEDYLLDFGAKGELAALVPGNHDSTFFGNFAWHPDWESACRPVGPDPAAAEAWKLLPPSKRDVNQWLQILMNDMQVGAKSRVPNAHAGNAKQDVSHADLQSLNGGGSHMISFRDLGSAGNSRVVGAFVDTSDYSEAVLGVAGAQGTISGAQLRDLKHALCAGPEDLSVAPPATYRKHKVVLFLHHPRSALSDPSQQHLFDLADCLGDRLLALVSAHTHMAETRPWRARDVPELVVGSILDPPQEASLLTIAPEGTVRLETIPSVRRSHDRAEASTSVQAPAATSKVVTLNDCRLIYEKLDDEPLCKELMQLPILHDMPPNPLELKRRQQDRARRLLKCLEIKLDDEPAPFDGTCERGDLGPACPLNAPDLYDKIDAVVRDPEGKYAGKRTELICLARAASLLQGHKKEGWSFGRALQHAGDPTADEDPIVIQCPPGSSHCKVELAPP